MNSMLWAMGMAAPGQGQAQGGSPFGMFVPMIIIFAIFYFMLLRPQQRKEKERRKMIENVKSGDRILFCGGILGTVTNVKESVLVVKVADNVKLDVLRGAVSRVLDKDEKVDSTEA